MLGMGYLFFNPLGLDRRRRRARARVCVGELAPTDVYALLSIPCTSAATAGVCLRRALFGLENPFNS